MTWHIDFTDRSRKALKRLDKIVQQRIVNYLDTRVAPNPRQYGDPLTGDKKGLWRYRVGDYRIIAELSEGKLLVLVVQLGHRKDVYDF